jgi:hypothetical protein
MGRLPTAVFVAFALPGLLPAQLMTRLSPENGRAFDDYIKGVEAKLDWRARVVLDKPGVLDQPGALDQPGVTLIPGATPPTVDLKGAIIHDWLGAILAPGATLPGTTLPGATLPGATLPGTTPPGTTPPGTTLEKLLAVLESYDDYPRLYAPQITASKVYSHEGNLWRVYLQLYKKKLFTANLATEYEIEYRPLGLGRWAILSRSTKVAELDGGRELPVGQGHGFLWRLNTYWLLEQRPEGVYIECHAISMSRDVPTGLGWAMKPMVTSIPRESLRDTLEATVRALQ